MPAGMIVGILKGQRPESLEAAWPGGAGVILKDLAPGFFQSLAEFRAFGVAPLSAGLKVKHGQPDFRRLRVLG
jgi:hypothetical protein